MTRDQELLSRIAYLRHCSQRGVRPSEDVLKERTYLTHPDPAQTVMAEPHEEESSFWPTVKAVLPYALLAARIVILKR
jgi:hypothetical protein